MTAGLPLMKSILTSLAKTVLLSIRLSAGILAGDAALQKNILIRNYCNNDFK